MNLFLAHGLGEQGHAESSKVGPEEQVKGMEGVGATGGMFDVIWTSVLTISCKLHTTVIQQAFRMNLGVILHVYGYNMFIRTRHS